MSDERSWRTAPISVARLVRQRANHLARIFGRHKQTSGHEQPLSARDKCVGSRGIDQVNANRAGVEPGRQQYWRGKVANGIFDFSIENLLLLFGGRNGVDRDACGDRRRQNGAQGTNAHGHGSNFHHSSST